MKTTKNIQRLLNSIVVQADPLVSSIVKLALKDCDRQYIDLQHELEQEKSNFSRSRVSNKRL